MNWATIKTLFSSWYAWIAPALLASATTLHEFTSNTSLLKDFEFGFYSRVFLLSVAFFLLFCLGAKIFCPEPIKKFKSKSEAVNYVLTEAGDGSDRVEELAHGRFEKEIDKLFSRFRMKLTKQPGDYRDVEGAGRIASKVISLMPAKRMDRIGREYQLAATDWGACMKLYPAIRLCLTGLFSLALLLYLSFFLPRFASIFWPGVSTLFSTRVSNVLSNLIAFF